MLEAGVIVKMFKALGDPVRLRLFALIAAHNELCVCHLTAALELPQSTVSRQLGVLRHAGLVQARRDGKWMYYRQGELAAPLATMIAGQSDPTMHADVERLNATLSGCP